VTVLLAASCDTVPELVAAVADNGRNKHNRKNTLIHFIVDNP
jgi:hypothetical protein